jgi:NAD(P)-dependent dehydrogenase (short-subunit alcohol dehydrogenase family)
MSKPLLEHKLIIIAGGAGLIGKNLVKTILEFGGTVIVSDINAESGEKYVNELRKVSGYDKAYFSPLDITSKSSILSMINDICNRFGKIDGFVNCTYPKTKNYGKKLEDVTYSDFCENLNIHLGGYFLATKHFAVFFKNQGFGNIINFASILGVVPPKFDTYSGIIHNGEEMRSPIEYSAIKSGIIMISKYIAKYFKGSNFRCNIISPGGIIDNHPLEFQERYKKYCTSKGLLEPEDIGGTVIFLLSDLSKSINGVNIIIDDGWIL